MALFSIPVYPGAVQYNVQYSDPTVGDPYAPNPLGPWTAVSGSPFTSNSNIYDAAGGDNRMYRVQPVVVVNHVNVPLRWYDPFLVNEIAPTQYAQYLYDPQITGGLLPFFRSYIQDYGDFQVASSDMDLDTGAGETILAFDGVRTVFDLASIPDAQSAVCIEGLVTVVKGGLTLRAGIDYWMDYPAGQIHFTAAPDAGDVVSVSFRQATWTNAQLNESLRAAIDSLPQLGIQSYFIQYDRNVVKISATLPDDGLKGLIFKIGQRVLDRAIVSRKAMEAKSARIGDFSIDTAPSRTIEGMTTQGLNDWNEIKAAANNYIRTATTPIVYDTYQSYFNVGGVLPTYSFLIGIGGFSWWI